MLNKQPTQWYEVFATHDNGIKEPVFKSQNLIACHNYIDTNNDYKLLTIHQWKRMKHGPVLLDVAY